MALKPGKKSGDEVFARESVDLERYRAIALASDVPADAMREILLQLLKGYEAILEDNKIMVLQGDRMQRKLKSAYTELNQQKEEIERQNIEIQKINRELQLTLNALMRAKASRKAQTLTLFLALGLFIFSEIIENLSETFLSNFWISFGVKVLLVLLLKPIESFLESYFHRQTIRKDERRIVAQYLGKASSEKKQTAEEFV
ncbi:MAG: hypothetical protein RMM53_12090 [Bacteroidia bacterium]|nr:hypothetical protein [Bacteroidia bacterium]MDW8334946.1 hypothetical protein [Bacteroidia bacterium]